MVRRPLLLAMLERHLGSSRDCDTSTAGVPEPTVVVLLGLGSQGKTQVALDYHGMTRALKGSMSSFGLARLTQTDTGTQQCASSSNFHRRYRLAEHLTAPRTKVALVKDWLISVLGR
jgi:hypothetical protein